ncbi:hypothetical protein DDE18_16865 [Nocardioides gansuensis]|uniref:Peptidase M10 metallopeptidase domain-containing protein n=1 Tax=Nocardioides gansuensis TaxID=2138300 RepID=A0A2T8F7G4_9ACTN|nr:matrixin family metalloprotease [Nocardioides gansuensis]PVG81661.1 hypothetical protein DDE18_16865 [Nocardioides gansuensis]
MKLRRRPALRHMCATVVVTGLALALAPAAFSAGARDAAGQGAARPAIVTAEYGDSVHADDAAKLNRAARIAVTAPESAEAGARLVVSGVVLVRAGRHARPRPVELLESTSSGWQVLARRRTARTGAFRFEVSAGSEDRTRAFQVRSPRFDGLRAAQTQRLIVKVVASAPTPTPTPAPVTDLAPAGLADDWSYLFVEGGARWNPCTPIRWAYNPQGGYAGSLAHAQEAFAQIANRTGLRFEYVGETTYVHRTGSTFPAHMDIAIAWSDQTQVPELQDDVVGLGGGSAHATDRGADVAWRMVRGFVVLDRDHALRPGFDTSGSTTWGQVIVHETLHALGLGHANGAEQVMHGGISSLNHNFGAGDLTGMGVIGAARGCL